LKQTENVEILIFNTTGQLIEQKSYAALKGRNKFEFLLTDENQAGNYFYMIRTGSSVISGKMIKL
ncbi:MAG: T9SS type A sorting domain-containing protein, partial [Bacteroidales bacterium]|nr:T9SS type A sorting domain-containing protein [Bacteroidales bacterium]